MGVLAEVEFESASVSVLEERVCAVQCIMGYPRLLGDVVVKNFGIVRKVKLPGRGGAVRPTGPTVLPPTRAMRAKSSASSVQCPVSSGN